MGPAAPSPSDAGSRPNAAKRPLQARTCRGVSSKTAATGRSDRASIFSISNIEGSATAVIWAPISAETRPRYEPLSQGETAMKTICPADQHALSACDDQPEMKDCRTLTETYTGRASFYFVHRTCLDLRPVRAIVDPILAEEGFG
jgi:hypothetical protein